MSSENKDIDPEIRDLMESKADEYGVPTELLEEIYKEEQRVVNMDLRQDIHTNIKDLLETHVDDWEMPE